MARSVAGAASPSRLNRKFLVVAVLLAVLSAVLVYAKISATSGTTPTAATTGNQTVVVAKVAIQPRTVVTADQLMLKSISAGAVIGGSFGNIADAVGRTAKYPIQANEQVTASNVIDTSKPVSGSALSLVVPAGKRAMSIQASQVSNAGGLILPGDFVDIIWTCCSGKAIIAKTLLHNVQVAAVAQTVIDSGPVTSASKTPAAGGSSTAPVASGAAKPDPTAQTVTLLLSPQEAEQVFLAEQNGTLRADLRGVSDTNTTDPGVVNLLNILPPSALAGVPDVLKPDGYKPGQ
ncbi:MAG: Flp pilus assembly protein CpaB [Dehalococcoidia bacterium]